MAFRQGIDEVQSMLVTGRLVIDKRCEKLIEQMNSYQWSPDSDKPIHKNCDGPDALRYAVMTRIMI